MVRKIKKTKGKKRDEATLKRMRLQFQMTSAELIESELILEECMFDFNERFETGREPKLVEESEAQEIARSERSFEAEEERKEKERKENRVEHEDVLPEDKDLKNLFKKIALKTHPDKLRDMDDDEADALTELYKEAAGAAEVGDGMALLEIAYELGIKVDIDPAKETEWLSKKVLMLQEDISEMKNTAEWIWGHSDGSERMRIEKMVMNQLGFKLKPLKF
jgi:rRNA maturation endonuclease Nob1